MINYGKHCLLFTAIGKDDLESYSHKYIENLIMKIYLFNFKNMV